MKWEPTFLQLTWEQEELLRPSRLLIMPLAPYSTKHQSNDGDIIMKGNWGLVLQTALGMEQMKWVITSQQLTLEPAEQLQPLRLDLLTIERY